MACTVASNRDTPPTDGDYDKAVFDECIYGIALDNLPGDRRWYDSTPATPGILNHHPAVFVHLCPCLFLRIKRANGFACILHSGVIPLDKHLRAYGDPLASNSTSQYLLL